jgi:hypothetical protein
MLRRAVFVVAVAVLVFGVPVGNPQTEQAQPTVYTYVSQFQVPRDHWAQFAEENEKTVNPILERLLSDGTLVSWSNFENIVHTPEGMTHGSAWSSTSLAGVVRVLDEIRKGGPRPGQIASTKHEDFLMRSIYYHNSGTPGAGNSGYLRVNCSLTQPGKGEEFVAAFKKYLVPTFEDQLKKGNAVHYGMDTPFVQTVPGSMRCTVVVFPNGEAMNKWAEAISARVDKLAVEDKGFQDALTSSTVPNSRRDFLARITHYAHK